MGQKDWAMKPYRQFTLDDIQIKIHRLVFLIPGMDPLGVVTKFFYVIPKKTYGHFLEKILIGHFPELAKYKKTAGYKNGTIFVSSFLEEGNHEKKYGQQKPGAELLKNLIHEAGHVFEQNYYDMLFIDPALKSEFLKTRRRVASIFGDETGSWVSNAEDAEGFSAFLEKKGFSEVRTKTIGFLPNPYCLDSLSEFIAYCFEEFFMRDRKMVEGISPTIFSILSEVSRGQQEI